MTDKQMIIDDEHDMNYCEDNNCKHYGNKEQCEKTHCYYRCYSKLYTAHKRKEQECEKLKEEIKTNGFGCFNIEMSEQLDQLKKTNEELKKENEELKKIINEAKNSNLDLKSFLVGEAVQNEYEQQLDQLNAENESLKESLKMFSSTLDWALKSQVGLYKRQIDSSVPDDWEYEEVLVLVEQYIEKIKQTLTEIKEIAEGMHDLWINKTTYTDMDNLVKHLLECELNRIRYKLDEISECEVENANI